MKKYAVFFALSLAARWAVGFTDSLGTVCLNQLAQVPGERLFVNVTVGFDQADYDTLFSALSKFGNNTCLSASIESAGVNETQDGAKVRNVFLKVAPRAVCTEVDQQAALIKSGEEAIQNGVQIFCGAD